MHKDGDGYACHIEANLQVNRGRYVMYERRSVHVRTTAKFVQMEEEEAVRKWDFKKLLNPSIILREAGFFLINHSSTQILH